MAFAKRLILANISFFKKDSVIENKYDVYITEDLELISSLYSFKAKDFIPSVNLLGEDKEKTYLNVNKPLWGIEFISSIDNNIDERNSNLVEDLVEGISEYSTCRVPFIIKDVQDLFTKQDDKYGIETRKFILLFEEYSYYDSYAGDGDYSIEYSKVVSIKDITEEMKKDDDKYCLGGFY